MEKKYNAFTIIELLVVMAIIALLGTLGIYGLTRFRANVEVQTAFNDVFSLLKLLQNDARNSVQVEVNGSSETPSYYAVSFNENIYEAYACNKSGGNVFCLESDKIDLDITVNLTNIIISYVGAECNYIGFERLTGDMVDITGNPTWAINSNDLCTVEISNIHGDTRKIEINLDSNTIKDAGT